MVERGITHPVSRSMAAVNARMRVQSSIYCLLLE
jgi:hypothetical protein